MNSKPRFDVLLLSKIVDPARPMRTDLTPESVEELAKSIAQVGLLEPLVVRKDHDNYEVIAGHRRLMACTIADLVDVPCYIFDVTDEQVDTMRVHENLHRKDISPIEEGRYFRYLKESHGWSPEKIAEMISKSEAYVWARMSIDKYPPDILEALEGGGINIAVARELAQIDDETTRIQYLDYAVKNGVTSVVAEQWKQQYKAGRSIPLPSGNDGGEVLPKPPESVTTIECVLCGGQVPMREAKIVYTHTDCLVKFQSANNTPN